MLVKDLIYLLQTRCKPDLEVYIAAYIDGARILTQLENSFDTVLDDQIDYVSGHREDVCMIYLREEDLKRMAKEMTEETEVEVNI